MIKFVGFIIYTIVVFYIAFVIAIKSISKIKDKNARQRLITSWEKVDKEKI